MVYVTTLEKRRQRVEEVKENFTQDQLGLFRRLKNKYEVTSAKIVELIKFIETFEEEKNEIIKENKQEKKHLFILFVVVMVFALIGKASELELSIALVGMAVLYTSLASNGRNDVRAKDNLIDGIKLKIRILESSSGEIKHSWTEYKNYLDSINSSDGNDDVGYMDYEINLEYSIISAMGY